MDISVAQRPLSADHGPVIRLTQFARLMRRYAWLIALTTLLCSLVAFLYARMLPKTYTANSTITVEGGQFDIPELQGAVRNVNAPDPMPWVRTEVQALSSRALVQQVINEMHLDRDAEFNPYLQPPTLFGDIKGQIMGLFPQSPSSVVVGPDEAVLQSVTKSLGVFQDNRSLVIALSFTAQDPQLAANFLNRLLASYIQSRASNRNSVNQQANAVLVQRTAQAKADLEAVQKQMQDLRTKTDVVNLRAGSVSQQQLEDLATAAARATMQRSQLEADVNRANALAKQGLSDALVSVLNSPTIGRLRDQESAAASRVADLSSRYGSDYPSVRSAAADLAAVRRQLGGEVQRIVASMSAQLKVARDQEAQVQQQLASAQRAGVLAGNVNARLAQLQEEEKSRRTIYETLLVSEQHTESQPAATQTPDVRVLSAAVPPGIPSGPDTKLITGMGGLSGILLGCLLAFTRLHRLEDTEEFSQSTGIPVLASISHRLVRGGSHGLVARVTAQPPGIETEFARNLRTRLSFLGRSNVPRTVMFTATRDNDSAALIACAVARMAAADGERVLLIGANLQHPLLGKILGCRANGLAGVLTDFSDWRDMVERDRQLDLDMLISANRMAGTDALLGGLSFQTLLLEAREEYDLVVIEAPSADTADTVTLAQRVDAAVVVTDMRTRRGDLAATASRLASVSRNPVHALLVT